jgi:hypothetical protein
MFYRSYASPLGSRHKKKAFTLGSAEVRCECNSIWQEIHQLFVKHVSAAVTVHKD